MGRGRKFDTPGRGNAHLSPTQSRGMWKNFVPDKVSQGQSHHHHVMVNQDLFSMKLLLQV